MNRVIPYLESTATVARVIARSLRIEACLQRGDYGVLAGLQASSERVDRQLLDLAHLLKTKAPRAFVVDAGAADHTESLIYKFASSTRGSARFDEPSLRKISESCANLMRLHRGQYHIPFEDRRRDNETDYELAHETLWEWGHRGESLSLADINIDANIAYDVHQVIRRDLAFRKTPEGGVFNHFDKPMKTSPEPFIEIVYA